MNGLDEIVLTAPLAASPDKLCPGCLPHKLCPGCVPPQTVPGLPPPQTVWVRTRAVECARACVLCACVCVCACVRACVLRCFYESIIPGESTIVTLLSSSCPTSFIFSFPIF